jgi:uncharacterized membrane protein YedE/YeeE
VDIHPRVRHDGRVAVLAPLTGGALIGVAAAIALAFDGRIAGVSGTVARLPRRDGGLGFRAAFLLGLALAGVAGALVDPAAIGAGGARLPWVAAAGLLVGWGATVSNGCTSGHGVCGVARLSPRSIVAVATFMTTGAITVAIVRAIGGLR